MSKVEKIKRYVERARKEIPDKIRLRYDMGADEWAAMYRELDPLEAIDLAFSYGISKGYRAARSEARRG